MSNNTTNITTHSPLVTTHLYVLSTRRPSPILGSLVPRPARHFRLHKGHWGPGIFLTCMTSRVESWYKGLNWMWVHWGSEQQEELRYQVTYHTYVRVQNKKFEMVGHFSDSSWIWWPCVRSECTMLKFWLAILEKWSEIGHAVVSCYFVLCTLCSLVGPGNEAIHLVERGCIVVGQM